VYRRWLIAGRFVCEIRTTCAESLANQTGRNPKSNGSK
jgi:hypothetical protein